MIGKYIDLFLCSVVINVTGFKFIRAQAYIIGYTCGNAITIFDITNS